LPDVNLFFAVAGKKGKVEKSVDNFRGARTLESEVEMIYKVILIKIDHRSTEAVKIQSILTDYGCNIKVRLGLHEVSKEFCANDGLIVLEVDGDKRTLNKMIKLLNAVEYVQAQLIEM
jgi:hypothetical protein